MTAETKPDRPTGSGWQAWAVDGGIALAITAAVGLAFWAWSNWGFEAMLNGLARFCL